MARNNFNNSQGDNDGSNPLNWSLGALSATDNLFLDGSVSHANCTFTADVVASSIEFDNAYAGTVSIGANDVTLDGVGASYGLDHSNSGSATLLMGSGTWNMNGTGWQANEIGTFDAETATLRFYGGTTKDFYPSISGDLYNLTVDAGTQIRLRDGENTWGVSNHLDCSGIISVTKFHYLTVRGTATASITGTVTDDNAIGNPETSNGIYFNSGATITNLSGSIEVNRCYFTGNITLPAQACTIASEDVKFANTNAVSGEECILPAGFEMTLTGQGDGTGTHGSPRLRIRQTTSWSWFRYTVRSEGGKIILDGVPEIEFSDPYGSSTALQILEVPVELKGSVSWDDQVTGGLMACHVTLTACDLTLASDLNCQSLNAVSDNGTGLTLAGFSVISHTGDITLASGFSIADSLNGIEFSARGDISLNGQTLSATASWELASRGGFITFNGAGSIAHCDASANGLHTVYADGWTDGGNNQNITFGPEPTFDGLLRHKLYGYARSSLWSGLCGAWSPLEQGPDPVLWDQHRNNRHLNMRGSGELEFSNWMMEHAGPFGGSGWAVSLNEGYPGGNGSESLVQNLLEGDPCLGTLGDLTLSIWAKPRNHQSGHGLMSFTRENSSPEQQDENGRYWLSWGSGGDITTGHEYGPGSNETKSWNANASIDVWHHIIYMRDAAARTMDVYVNDVHPAAIHTYTNDPEGGELAYFNIGDDPPNINNGNFNGCICAAAVWHRVLNTQERECLHYEGRRCMYRKKGQYYPVANPGVAPVGRSIRLVNGGLINNPTTLTGGLIS